VTTVRDLAWVPGHSASFELRDALNENPQNARLVAVGPVVTTVGGYPGFGLEVTSSDDAWQKINTLIDDGADLIKIAIEDDLPKGRRWPMLSPEDIGAIVKIAHARGLPIVAHISRARHLEIAIEAGVDDMAHMIVNPLPDDLVTRMIDQDMYWEPTLELWDCVRRQHGADWDAAAIDNLGRFAAAGGKVALGTDFAGYICDFELGMPMTEIALMQKAGMTPMQIIMAATKHAAQVCNLGPQLGTLEPGKIADIIVVVGDPLDDIAAMQNVRIVVHNGILIRNDIE
jgi:imidazolonepropionase-like amidohydrolase